MIIVMKRQATAKQVDEIFKLAQDFGVNAVKIEGTQRDVIGFTGDTTKIDQKYLQALESVSEVLRVSEPYKLANKQFHPDDTIIQVRDQTVGGEKLAIMAGPCSVEGEEHVIRLAQRMKLAGANFLRGGVFKPRSSPYSFQGLGLEGLQHMVKAREITGLPIVVELMSPEYLDEFVEHVDIIQIGARNMQNYDLLKEIGRTKTPVLLKRALSGTYTEWLMAAEYIMAEGNPNVMLCERGIRTYETGTRNTLDIQAVPYVQKHSHLPIIIDPSHAAGETYLVPAGARAGIAAGADGLIIETHEEPEKAWSDGAQCLKPDEFARLMEEVEKIGAVMNRTMPESDRSALLED